MTLLRTLLAVFATAALVASAPTNNGPGFEFVKEGDRHRLVVHGDRRRLRVRDPALQDSPSGGYAPKATSCPPTLTVRRPSPTGPLSSGEATYISRKAAISTSGWKAWLTNTGLSINQTTFFASANKGGVAGSSLPNVGFAVSGGGLRALLNGAGVLNGFDARNPAANSAKVGGLAELANYGSALSGGAWMATSDATSNFPTFPALNQTVWDLQESLALPEAKYPDEYAAATADVLAKQAAGYEVSLVDLYGRILSYHLINDTTKHGAATTFHSIRSVSNFQSNYAPYPIMISTSRNAGQTSIMLTNPIYESSPYEFGSWDPTLNGGAFIPIDYMGTPMTGGKPAPGPTACTVGFDNAGFVFGASSDIFGELGNTVITSIIGSNPTLQSLINSLPVGEDQYVDDALIPNPFQGAGGTYPQGSQSDLFLADGGFLENVPLWPLIQPARNLDAIIALDASADTSDNYPNGTSPYNTYMKTQMTGYGAYQAFPPIPSPDVFVAQGLNKKPVFFGCGPTKSNSPFILIYLPNYAATYAGTGTSTFQLQYTSDQVNGFFSNGAAIAAQNAGPTADPQWPQCLACAVIDRQNTRNKQSRTTQCNACFAKYCYN